MKHHHLLTGHRYAGAFKSTVFTVFIIAATQVFSQGPLITVRFANPQFDQITEMYCADVEFKSNIPDQQIFG
ncbi:MAG TPA: hypothetical protein VEA37_10270, partial [Flavobacterium sp.]|nr:hypothetical protein [Flavobacterium sp.]